MNAVEALPQYAFADRLAATLSQDSRVRAVWLEGSLGRGQGDRHSDVDLHVALNTEDLAAFRMEFETTLNRVGRVLRHHLLFGGTMVGTLLLNKDDQLIALQTWLSDAATLEISESRTRVLYDADQNVRVKPASATEPEEIRRALHVEITYFWTLFSTLPAIERGELLSTAYRVHLLAHQIILVAALGRGRTRDVGDWRLNELLSEGERRRLEQIVHLPELSQPAIINAHRKLGALMREIGQTASTAWRCEYPAALERAVLMHVSRELKRMGFALEISVLPAELEPTL